MRETILRLAGIAAFTLKEGTEESPGTRARLWKRPGFHQGAFAWVQNDLKRSPFVPIENDDAVPEVHNRLMII